MKKITKSLKLNRETVRVLAGVDLHNAAGGFSVGTCIDDSQCNPCRPTFRCEPWPGPSGGTAITCVALGCGPVMTL